MLTLRRAEDRGHAYHGWLESYHTFSFGSYYDPNHLGFSNLRVINDDTVAPDQGFATHGHSDMEIISYVLEGALEHKDSMGNGSVIRPGDVQRMSAGTGVTHSEFNHSSSESVHFLQIWLQPNQLGIAPEYDQKHFPVEERVNRLVLLVSPDGHDGSIASYQDALVYGTLLGPGNSISHKIEQGRRAYVHVATGAVRINDNVLQQGDGLRIENQGSFELEGMDSAEILLFDLP